MATPTTPQALMTAASPFTPVAESDVTRWAIVQLTNISAGNVIDVTPTLQQIEDAATTLEMQQSPKMLWAILLQQLLGLVGGGNGTALVLTGSANPEGSVFAPAGTIYTRVTAPGFGTIFTKTSAATLNTGWI